jgi:hypothetical protein
MAAVASQVLSRASPRLRRTGWIVLGAAVLYTVLYGVALGAVHTRGDSRLQAAQWVGDHVPEGAVIGVEGGGFSMAELIDRQRHRPRYLDLARLFYLGPYMLCSARADYVVQRLEDLDYVVIVEPNRAAQFLGASASHPVLSDLYRHLLAGNLGFEVAYQVTATPALLGHEFHGDRVDPSFVAYDHPTVSVWRRRPDPGSSVTMASWRTRIRELASCPDSALGQLAECRRGPGEVIGGDGVHDSFQWSLLDDVLESEAGPRMARASLEAADRRTRHVRNRDTMPLIPGALAASLAELGLPDEAMDVLLEGVSSSVFGSRANPRRMALSYAAAARQLAERGAAGVAEEALELSVGLIPTAPACNLLGGLARARGDVARATRLWQQSLSDDPNQPLVHDLLAEIQAAAGHEELSSYHGLQAEKLRSQGWR